VYALSTAKVIGISEIKLILIRFIQNILSMIHKRLMLFYIMFVLIYISLPIIIGTLVRPSIIEKLYTFASVSW